MDLGEKVCPFLLFCVFILPCFWYFFKTSNKSESVVVNIRRLLILRFMMIGLLGGC